MKNVLTLAAMAGLLTGWQAVAQTTDTNTTPATTTTTFNVQNLNVVLTGFAQNPTTGAGTAVKSVRISNKEIVQLLGGSSRAKLVILTDANDPTAPAQIHLRETTGKTNTDTDVTGDFSFTSGTTVAQTNSKGSGKEYSIDTFAFNPTDTTGNPLTTSFTVQGFSTTSLPKGNLTSQVNGPGKVDDVDSVLRGTITTSGGKTETVTQ